ncbi:MAG: 2-oxoacid:acceptor oxidoreductase family protein [Acidimicrobiia bacterium]
MARNEIRIAGAGGQGVVTAGRILAEAAILSGKRATHSQLYGPQSRGGSSRSDVVIATDTVGFPLADSIDTLVALSQKALDKYKPDLAVGSTLIIDSRCVLEEPDDTAVFFPVVDTARAVTGGELATGVVALGVLQAHTGLVDGAALERAVAARVPPQHRKKNLEALAAGMRLAQGAAA